MTEAAARFSRGQNHLPAWGKALWLAVALSLLFGCAKSDGELQLPNGREQPFNYSQWQGQWLLVNYWAEWCGPCRREIPELNQLNERPELQVVGVNFDGLTGSKLHQVGSKMQVAFPTLLTDPGPRFALARPTVLPVTLLIGPDGKLRETLRGPQSAASINAAVAAARTRDGVLEAPPIPPAA